MLSIHEYVLDSGTSQDKVKVLIKLSAQFANEYLAEIAQRAENGQQMPSKRVKFLLPAEIK